MKPYRIQHIRTGYYYRPNKGGGHNLSKVGKIYSSNNNVFNYNKGENYIPCTVSDKLYEQYKDYFDGLKRSNGFCIPKSDFKIEYI